MRWVGLLHSPPPKDGGVSEWLKERDWKSRKRVTVSGVRIPSPPLHSPFAGGGTDCHYENTSPRGVPARFGLRLHAACGPPYSGHHMNYSRFARLSVVAAVLCAAGLASTLEAAMPEAPGSLLMAGAAADVRKLVLAGAQDTPMLLLAAVR